MKKNFFKIFLLTVIMFVPVTSMARVDVHVSIPIPLPPPIIFPAPPVPVIIPETNVYAVPDVQEDVFFSAGWWWRPWEGRWYRSRYYDRGWTHFRGVPSFHRQIPPGWRDNYRNHEWKGHRWEYQGVPHQEMQRNWRSWERNRHWEKRDNWGVHELKVKERYKAKTRDRVYEREHGPGPGPNPGPGPHSGPGPGPHPGPGSVH